LKQLREIPEGAIISLTGVNVLEQRDGSKLVTLVLRSSSASVVESPRLPPLHERKVTIDRLEDGKLAMITGIAVDMDRRTYVGCPICHRGKSVSPGTAYTCTGCSKEVMAQELAWASLVVNDGTGDVICNLSPQFGNKIGDDVIGSPLEVCGIYDVRADTIEVMQIRTVEISIRELLQPPTPKVEEVPPPTPAVPLPTPIPEAEVKPEAIEVPKEIIQDVIAFIHFVGPMSISALEERLKSGRYPDFKGTADDVIQAIVTRGEGKFEVGFINKVE